MSSRSDYRELLVILPALNEELAIPPTLKKITECCPGAEVVVIDNGSIDNTASVAESLGAKVLIEPQKGKGFAVRRGFASIKKEHKFVFMVDADDTYGLENIDKALELVDKYGYDMVVGTRVESEKVEPGRKVSYKKGHTFGNGLLTLIAKKLHKVEIQDSLSGWRMMSSNFVRSFPGGASGFEIEAELNAHVFLLSAAVTNVEISYRGRDVNSHSKLKTYSDGFKILRMNFALFRDNRPQMAFTLFSIPWCAASLALIARAWIGYLNTGLVEQFPSLIAGIGSLIVAGLLLTSGVILQRIKLTRSNILRFEYQKNSN